MEIHASPCTVVFVSYRSVADWMPVRVLSAIAARLYVLTPHPRIQGQSATPLPAPCEKLDPQ
jgi:hypothetical protein